MKEKFKYRDVVYYEENGNIQEALFSEHWENDTTYVQRKEGEISLPTDRIFPSIKELLKAKLEEKEKEISTNDSIIEERTLRKPYLKEELVEIQKQLTEHCRYAKKPQN